MKKAELITLAESVKPVNEAVAAKVKAKAKKLTTFPEYHIVDPTKVPEVKTPEVKTPEVKAEDGNEVSKLASQVFNATKPLDVLMSLDKGTRRKVRQFLYQKGYKHLASLKTPPTAPSQHQTIRRLAVA